MDGTSVGEWTPVWAMPNVSVDYSVDSQFVAIVNCRDDRITEVAKRHPVLTKFLNRFRTEFGALVWPTIIMFRAGAPENIRSVTALAAFRDVVSICAISSSHSRLLTWGRPVGIMFSDAFDFYPWVLGSDWSDRLYAFTPAISGIHQLEKLHAQSAPAIGNRNLGGGDLDETLLEALLGRWQDRFGAGNETTEHLRLFRAIDMARAASRMPGSTDATFYDGGRAVALWVSAFEILAHDKRVDLKRVLNLLHGVQWVRQSLAVLDRTIKYGHSTINTNTAGEIYRALHRVRNDFLHGEPVTQQTLLLPRNGRHILHFAAPLFRLALTAYLDLRFENSSANLGGVTPDLSSQVIARMNFSKHQRSVEEAILTADADREVTEED